MLHQADNSEVVVSDTSLSHNAATGSGAIAFTAGSASLALSRCRVQNNEAAKGAVVVASEHASLVWERSNFTENTAADSGGVAMLQDASTLSASHCSWRANRAGVGGALWVGGSAQASLGQCAAIGNAASQAGGVVTVIGNADAATLQMMCSHPRHDTHFHR